MRFSPIISRYLIGAVVPYFVFAWILLSVILFVQQAGRFSDIFFSVNIPSGLIWQLTLALIPNVIAFTCPMAVLVGVIIGLTKMQSDSELTAIRASGVGNFQITLPFALLGILLSLFAFVINLVGVPFAARVVRQVAMRSAIYKLESPIEPGTFNTEIAGFTIYVKDGDVDNGRWKNIFMHAAEKDGTVRLITSSEGRIDYKDQLSELVLENAVVTTFSNSGKPDEKFVSEKVGQIRYAVKTRRDELINKLSTAELTPEELGLSALSKYAGRTEGKERIEAEILWQRRIVLSVTPFLFCLLGSSLVLRFSRRGRGFGIFVALVMLIAYYLLAFLGEQLARTEQISSFAASIIPITASVIAIVWFNLSTRISSPLDFGIIRLGRTFRGSYKFPQAARSRNLFVDITTGLRDFDIILNLAKYYLLALAFLASVFVIFTAFELWKFAGSIDGGIQLLLQYLLFLMPFVYLQLAPSAAMIATLATFVIKSRQNEIVTWTSAGQSVYRLLLPCLIFMLALGLLNWTVQETIAPHSNRVQDELRDRIRSRGALSNVAGRHWLADDDRIYAFELTTTGSDNDKEKTPQLSSSLSAKARNGSASDNENTVTPGCHLDSADPIARNLTIYDFVDKGAELQFVYRADCAEWRSGSIRFIGPAVRITVGAGFSETVDVTDGEFQAESNPFRAMRRKPSHLSARETRYQLADLESDVELRNFEVSLEKKYSTLLLPFIIALFTAPFSLSLSRKGKVATVGYAIGLWLLFMGINSIFEQIAYSGQLPPRVSVWGPLVLFSMLGVYLMSKVKT